MTDTYWAAREGDALLHTAPMADLLGGVLEIAASVAVGTLATTAVVAATGLTVATGGLGCLVLGSAVGIAVGVGMNQTGTDEEVKQFCDWLSNALFPPTVQAYITTGSPDTFINGKPAARAAGRIGPVLAGESAGYLDIAQGFFSQLWRPTVATPAPGAIPSPYDRVACDKHPPMPQVYLAEGSSKVTINGQPAVRTGDRSTCEARVGAVNGLISPNVRIGGAPVVIREIRSGKPPGVGLAVGTLLMLRGGGAKFFSQLPCMLVGGLTSWGTGQVSNALSAAMSGSPNPVHAATGAKVLGGEDELDFALPGLLPLDWQRFYNSRDERHDSLLGQGWSLPYEINVRLEARPEGGERLIYTDEQARQIDMGSIPLGHAVFSAGEGLSVRRHDNGQLLIESEDGLYRLFEPTLADPSRLRLSQLGDRNDNRLYLDYSKSGTLIRLRDTFDQVQVELIYHSPQGPRRIGQIERLYPDQTREVLVSYDYDAAGDLSEVRDATGQVQRRFAYDEHRRLVEHQLPGGLRCFYQWALIETQETQETQKTQKTQEWRVTRHWTDDGDDYQFDYDLEAGITRITDGLRRVSTLQWNRQYQITAYTDPLGHTWQFQWNDERQLLGAIDPQDGHWRFSYDASGNLSTSEDPLGRIDSTLWLEHWSLPQVQTDAAGQAWQYRYDQRGNCLSETDPLGHTTTYRYDAFGQVVEIIDATGKSRTLRWNECGQLTYHADCSDYPTDFYYDRRGHLCTVADAFGERVHYQRDAQGRLLQTERPVDRFDHYQRDAHGQLIAHIDAAGGSTRYQYNRRGQVRQRTDALGRQIEYHYDAYGRLQALTNENGESYRFAWDANDRLIRQQDLDGSARQYSYDALDNVTRVEHLPAPFGTGLACVPAEPVPPIVHRLERDALGRLIAKITADGRTTYSYDRLDQVTAITFTDHDGNEQTLNFAYDALGRLLEEQSAAGSLQHHYDELGNLSQTQLPDGRWLNRLYYGSGHLHQLNLDGEVISDFERDRLHRELSRTQGQLNTRSEYDRCGRLRSRVRRPNNQPEMLSAARNKYFEYDVLDNLIERDERDNPARRDQRQHLHYDATDRIIATQENPRGHSETFAYDAAANLLNGQQQNAGRVVYNKLLTYQDKRYRYDGFGRMIEKRSASHRVQRFAYDAEHRLIEVHNQDGVRETVVRMTYDPLGRRIGKTEHNHNGYLLGETRFTWDGLRLLQEHKNTQTSLYLYVDEGYEPLARVDGLGDVQKIRYYHTDPNGLPEQLTEADGTRVWQARYKVWGNTLEEVREPYYIEEQNLRFQGQYLDRETGLHYNTFRFYDPDVGRFTTPDPIGLAGGVNLYQYAPNTAGWIDPLGWASSNPGVYSVYFEAYLPSPEMYKLNDPTHFSEANRQLHYEVKNNPTLASQLENKYPGILNHVNPTSKGTFRGTAPRNTSWHHHGQVGGLLQLVDKKDHSSRHKDYHPKKSRRHYVGGRNVWGGGGRCR